MSEQVVTESGWARFWNRGGWWRALLLTVVYAVVYLGIGQLIGLLFGDLVDLENPLGDPTSILLTLVVPILLGGLLLLLFAWSVGWLPGIFGRQPIAGRGWMWIAVALVVIPIVIRLLGTDWSSYSVAVVLTILLAGLCIGFTEELLTRGLGVNLLRRGGYSERVVMVLSSVLFAALHAVNAISGQPIATVAVTLVYTFGFGAMMYLSMRVTGSLVWAMLLHAATDPTTILAVGGIDTHSQTGGSEALLSVAGLFNYVYVLFALLAIFFVKGRVQARATAKAEAESGVEA